MFSSLLGICLGVEFLGHRVILFMLRYVLRNCQTVFKRGCMCHFTFPPTVYEDCNFSTSSPILTIFLFIAILVKCEVVSHGLTCISLITNDINHLFMCLLVIFISPLVKRLFRSFNWVI